MLPLAINQAATPCSIHGRWAARHEIRPGDQDVEAPVFNSTESFLCHSPDVQCSVTRIMAALGTDSVTITLLSVHIIHRQLYTTELKMISPSRMITLLYGDDRAAGNYLPIEKGMVISRGITAHLRKTRRIINYWERGCTVNMTRQHFTWQNGIPTVAWQKIDI